MVLENIAAISLTTSYLWWHYILSVEQWLYVGQQI